MTEQLAKQIFEALLDEFRRNNLTDILTFAIPPNESQKAYYEYSSDYSYRSTETELQFLINLSTQNDRGASRALVILLEAGSEYFNKLSGIPHGFSQRINRLFDSDSVNYKIAISGNWRQVELNHILEQPNINKLIRLLDFLREYRELDDDRFLTELDTFLTEI
ncbi:hypothetical protein SAMN05428975_3981 [Mucilaginibacter sp. OK268]|uniref:hypothetical protein n=1 Tax=Mucilaginibacter sp. OK268 TaxID=1881048 RepID=UPI0008864835|nr:hypothetical protein [Mucilaginibacter sp. OK268]SDP94716.1 hypothetical protein SAMN05428975_3981 [Mucilaginibacter sp. OK268]